MLGLPLEIGSVWFFALKFSHLFWICCLLNVSINWDRALNRRDFSNEENLAFFLCYFLFLQSLRVSLTKITVYESENWLFCPLTEENLLYSWGINPAKKVCVNDRAIDSICCFLRIATILTPSLYTPGRTWLLWRTETWQPWTETAEKVGRRVQSFSQKVLRWKDRGVLLYKSCIPNKATKDLSLFEGMRKKMTQTFLYAHLTNHSHQLAATSGSSMKNMKWKPSAGNGSEKRRLNLSWTREELCHFKCGGGGWKFNKGTNKNILWNPIPYLSL